jgi:hypothetical protein
VRPGPAGLRIEQPVVERPAEATDDRGDGVDLVGVDIVAAAERAQVVALDVGCQIRAFDAEDHAGDLIVAPELATADDARRGLGKTLALAASLRAQVANRHRGWIYLRRSRVYSQ